MLRGNPRKSGSHDSVIGIADKPFSNLNRQVVPMPNGPKPAAATTADAAKCHSGAGREMTGAGERVGAGTWWRTDV